MTSNFDDPTTLLKDLLCTRRALGRESKRRLEASLESQMESMWRVESSLKNKLRLVNSVESK